MEGRRGDAPRQRRRRRPNRRCAALALCTQNQQTTNEPFVRTGQAGRIGIPPFSSSTPLPLLYMLDRLRWWPGVCTLRSEGSLRDRTSSTVDLVRPCLRCLICGRPRSIRAMRSSEMRYVPGPGSSPSAVGPWLCAPAVAAAARPPWSAPADMQTGPRGVRDVSRERGSAPDRRLRRTPCSRRHRHRCDCCQEHTAEQRAKKAKPSWEHSVAYHGPGVVAAGPSAAHAHVAADRGSVLLQRLRRVRRLEAQTATGGAARAEATARTMSAGNKWSTQVSSATQHHDTHALAQ